MKKKNLLLLALVVAMLMLSACSGSNTSSTANNKTQSGGNEATTASGTEKTTVEVWSVWDVDAESGSGKALRDASEKFMEENPDIEITIANQGSYDKIAEKIETSIVGKTTPTLATVEETHVKRFAPVCANLTDYLSKDIIGNYNEGLLLSCNIDGEMKAVPFGRSSTILYMNKNLLEKAGLPLEGPKTWEEFDEYAKKMTDSATDTYGWGQDWDTDGWIWESMMYSRGGEIISDDLKTVLFNEGTAGTDTIAHMQRMAKEGYLFNPYEYQGEAWDILKAKFVEGKVGLMINSIASSSGIKKLANENGFDILLDYQPKGTRFSMPTGGNNIIMFNEATEEQKQAATRFLEFLASDEIASIHTMESGYFPITKTAINSDIMQEHLKNFPTYQNALDQLQYAHTRPMTKNWKNMYTVLMDELSECMVNTDTDPAKAVESAAEKCQKILDENPD